MKSRITLGLFAYLLLFSFSGSAQRFMRLPESWKFRLDSANVGVSQQWFGETVNDSKWNTIKIGSIWEDQDYEYDGYAWYRVRFSLPKDWGNDSVFVILGGVDDIYDLYLNGKLVASHGDLEKHVTVYSTFTSTDLTALVLRTGENLLAIRVYDWGGGGGIWKQPMAIVSKVKPFMPGDVFLREAAEKHPEWAVPRWAKKKGLAWTMVGMENGVHEVLRSIDGSFGSTVWPFTISVWLFDPATRKLHAPEYLSTSECSSSLKNGFLPISIYSFPAGDLFVESRLFVNSRGDIDADAVAYCAISVRKQLAGSANAKLVIAIRPYLVNANTGNVRSIRIERNSMMTVVNDSIPILFDK